MGIEKITKDLLNKVKNATINYKPTLSNLESNKTRALIGAGSIGALYLIPGDQKVITALAVSYTLLKTYHCIKDWANK
jgi:hypothetical protein